ncbi:MAG TPA: GNAT family N-acetyltransferase [Limnobacter sp.]|uniref:GNAT family N-acetyltransferase n=1 Tax=Limnobacter sp. TaxID=2003368 RepID=UPI002EDB4494
MQICQSIGEIAQETWNSLLRSRTGGLLHPALRHEYLFALERSGSATAETGWAPLHLRIDNEQGQTVAAMPLYLKSHSYGEYVFDWAWAQAYQRHGLVYYPKLLSAIPFTPILGPKLLFADPNHADVLRDGLRQVAQQACSTEQLLGVQCSGVHALFLNEQDQALILGSKDWKNLQSRHVVQFHWQNRHPNTGKPFEDFEHFLESLQQKKRKNIRAERRKAKVDGLRIRRIHGAEATADDLDFFYSCYEQTYLEHQSSPYLTPAFFREICANMGDQVLMIEASLHGQPVASTLFLFNQQRLYGRYWGSVQTIPCLHFELCYYQAIEFAIEHGIEWFEGGAQGEHKMARGLNPQTLVSAHWLASPAFQAPIAQFIEREKQHLAMYAQELDEHQAYRQVQATATTGDQSFL